MKFLRFWFPVIVYSGIIFCVSSVPNLKTPVEFFPHFDKVIHLLEYALLGFLLTRAVTHSWTQLAGWEIVVLVVLFSGAYGFSDEYHQLFVVGRSCDLTDWLADTLGGMLGGWLYAFHHACPNKE